MLNDTPEQPLLTQDVTLLTTTHTCAHTFLLAREKRFLAPRALGDVPVIHRPTLTHHHSLTLHVCCLLWELQEEDRH